MEKKIIFYNNIDDDPSDFTSMQDFAEAALDHVVADGITTQTRYSGFAVAKSAPTQITVATGRLYSAGKVYASGDSAWSKEFINALPVAGKRIAAVVTWGTEADSDVRSRQFLINAETRQAEPRPVALVHARIANIDVQLGQEAPDPVAPIVASGYTVVAWVVLSTTGVESVTMNEATSLTSVASLEGRVEDLETFEETAGFQIKTLASDIAALKASTSNIASQALLGRTLQRVAALEAKAGVPSAAVDSDADYFLDTTKSLLTDPLSNTSVQDGLRFPNAAVNTTPIQLFNPLDPFAMTKSGVLFPAYDREPWLETGTPVAETQVASFSQTTFDMVQKTMARRRIRYGTPWVISNWDAFWNTGNYDVAAGIFRRGTETFKVEDLGPRFWMDALLGVHMLRVTQYWDDEWQEAYWDKITSTISVPGAQVTETWLQGQDMWLDAVGLKFTRLANTGSVHVAICEVSDYGLPDLKSVIASTTVTREKLKLTDETVVSLQPTFLSAGKRYATVVTTAADHWVATVSGAQFPQGTFFYVLDGAYQQGDATRDLYMKLYRCKFRSSRTVINLSQLSLSGGILSIDLMSGAVVPSACSLSFEIQVAGIWYNMQDTGSYMLGQGGTIPPLLPLRAVFNGSQDVMPAINTLDSSITVSRPGLAQRHISTTRTLPTASSQIRVTMHYEAFDAAFHTATVKLLSGVSFATSTNPTSTTVVDLGNGAREVTYVFNLGSAITQFRWDTAFTTTSAQKVFIASWRKDYGL
ncbi:MAG: hypothetical protein KDK08_05795 [Rhizobiaceae bacterium]|nr:hypothetical protein [Rhizobiaceae bacterium]MCC0000973.1 hypothetical protein [Methylobacteriaceae bacterium]